MISVVSPCETENEAFYRAVRLALTMLAGEADPSVDDLAEMLNHCDTQTYPETPNAVEAHTDMARIAIGI